MAVTLKVKAPVTYSPSVPRNPRSVFRKKASPRNVTLHLSNTESLRQNQTTDHKYIVSGGEKLSGHVEISGSKNSALAIIAGTLCCAGTSVLHRIPNISDTKTMVFVLQSLGAQIEVSKGEMRVNTESVCSSEPCSVSVKKIRAGIFVLGPLLARLGEAVVPLPGGCNIGDRPVDLYLRGLRALGAIVELRNGKIYAYAANGRGLVGGRFHLDYPSVGATETLMMAASMAEGSTVLSNVAQEPEVADLAEFLIRGGASIEGVGTRTLLIKGKKRLHGTQFTIIPDRIEAGTFMVAAAITRSCILMSPVIPCHLTSVSNNLLAAGCRIRHTGPYILEVSSLQRTKGELQGVGFKTGPFPGFPTDLQPQLMAFLSTCYGSCVVEETVFEGRMRHVKELKKLGAKIQVKGSSALICGKGQSVLHGSQVEATDLRCGASLVLAGLAAQGLTEIFGAAHIDRGYSNLEMKLRGLGANIKREPNLSSSSLYC